MDIRSALAGQLYSDKKQPGPAGQSLHGGKLDFGQALRDSSMETLQGIRQNERTTMDGLAGKADAQSVVQALASTELAVQTATTVRDKVVEAYNEILRMPV